jgi:hypothetical protein
MSMPRMEITLNKPKMQVFQVENENTKLPILIKQ